MRWTCYAYAVSLTWALLASAASCSAAAPPPPFRYAPPLIPLAAPQHRAHAASRVTPLRSLSRSHPHFQSTRWTRRERVKMANG
jgi:hypothetical protein